MMIEKLKNKGHVGTLFSVWEDTMVYSCLQGIMGNIYVKDQDKPLSAIAIIGDFAFLAGVPDKDFILFKADNYLKNFIIMVPQNKEWAYLIEQCYQDKAKKVERYATKKEYHVFDKQKLQGYVSLLPKDYLMALIDENIFKTCQKMEWTQDLVSQYNDYQDYQKKGLGITIFEDGVLIAGASSYTRYKDGIEIQIDTKQEYRRKGLATICGAKLILECLKRNLYPSWDAQDKGSLALAKKLGYHYSHTYIAYEIYEYKSSCKINDLILKYSIVKILYFF